MNARVEVKWGQTRLAWIWVAGSILAFALMIMETMGPQAPLPAESGWQWFLPLVVPTLSLMLGTLVFQSRNEPPKATATVQTSVFLISVALSLLYLLLIVGMLAAWPFLRIPAHGVSAHLGRSKYWLPAVQGLVGIALGAFFVSKSEK